MGPTQTHGGTAQEGRTHGKRGITQEEVSLGIVRGRDYKIERSPLILDHSVMCILSQLFRLLSTLAVQVVCNTVQCIECLRLEISPLAPGHFECLLGQDISIGISVVVLSVFQQQFHQRFGGLHNTWRGTQFFLVVVLDWGLQVDLCQVIEQESSSCLIGGFLAGFQAVLQEQFRGVFFSGSAGH